MFNISRFILGMLICFLLFPQIILAQTSQADEFNSDSDFSLPPRAEITTQEFVPIDKSVIFDASRSFSVSAKGKDAQYHWDFGDGAKDSGIEVIHSYSRPGFYTVKLTVKNANGESGAQTDIYAYKRLVLLITDNDREQGSIEAMKEHALRGGVFLKIIQSFSNAPEFVSEENLIQKLAQSVESLKNTDQIIIWTKSGSGLKMINRLPAELAESFIDYADKDIIFITEEAIGTIGRIARGSYKFLKPRQIVVTRKEAVYPLLDGESTNDFLEKIEQRAIPFSLINDSSPPLSLFGFMTYTINYLVEKNIPVNSIVLVLMLPVIVTVIAFFKQIVGVNTLGVYTPAIITLSFLALEIKFGLLFLLAILAVGSLHHYVFRRYRLLYIPKMAILLIMVSLMIILILACGAFFNLSRMVTVSVFPILIMGALAEKFFSIQSDRGLKSAVTIILETIFVSAVAYLVIGGEISLFSYQIKFEFLRTLIFGYPEIIFLFLLINVFLGRWTGLRLSEYIRFREILGRAEEE